MSALVGSRACGAPRPAAGRQPRAAAAPIVLPVQPILLLPVPTACQLQGAGLPAERCHARRLPSWACQASPEQKPQEPSPAAKQSADEDFEGLTPEEDDTVPGSYEDALNGNTKLGKAVRAACAELEHLNDLELGVLSQADELLKKLGVKSSIMVVPPRPQQQPQEGSSESSSSSS